MRNLRQSVLRIAIIGLAPVATAAVADTNTGGSFQAYGTVLKVTPIVNRERIVEPFEQCRVVQDRRQTRYSPNHQRRIEPPHRVVRTIVGSLIGGAVGHQFGGGRGKDALTILGAFTGARIANGGGRRARADSNYEYRSYPDAYSTAPTSVEQCTQTERTRYVDQISGYRVRYRYNGETFTKTTTEHPGKRIPLEVRITPQINASR